MSEVEVYTIANGLRVGERKLQLMNGSTAYRYTFQIQVSHKAVNNSLYETKFERDNTGLRSNTDSKLFRSTWHLSILKNGKITDPWDLWEQAGFESRKLKSSREEKAAVDDYNHRVELAKKLMQHSIPKPVTAPPVQAAPAIVTRRRSSTGRRSSTKEVAAARTPEKRRLSNADSLASKSSASSVGKTDKAPKPLVRVTSIASTATGQASTRDPEKKGWRRGFLKR